MNNWIWNTFDAVSSMLLSSPAEVEEEGTTEHNDDAGGCISGSFLKKSDTLETAPSSDSFKTPSKPARARDVRELFDKAKLSPPKNALGDRPQEAVKQFVDGIFHNENNESKWNTMSPNEQAKCSFLFHLVQECMLPEALTREQLTQALDLGCPCGKRLESVTKRGGDSSFYDIPPGFPTLEFFLNKYDVWRDPKDAPTIFNGGTNSERRTVNPLYRTQGSDSPVCYALAATTAIYYRFQNGAANPGANITNVNRYMRNNIGDFRLLTYIFQGDGGYLRKTLAHLLQPWNPTINDEDAFFYTIDLRYMLKYSSIDGLYNRIIRHLGEMSAGGIHFKVFEDFVGDMETPMEKLTFTGKFSKKDPLPPRFGTEIGHAMLIVGARRTPNEHGGILFLAQNSWSHQIFSEIGLDLLLSMGECNTITFISPDLEFGQALDGGHESNNHGVPNGVVRTESASPRSNCESFELVLPLEHIPNEEERWEWNRIRDPCLIDCPTDPEGRPVVYVRS